MNKISVMLILEGTYPYNSGGVSTWAHILCNSVKNVSYTLYSMNANYELQPKYELGPNIVRNIQVPLWTPDEPYDYTDFGEEYYKIIGKKEHTSLKNIENKFVPLFTQLLDFIYEDNALIETLDGIFYRLWLYFEDNDYKETMRSELVWGAYCAGIEKYSKAKRNPTASLLDLTIGMRWLYRFLIPLSIVDVPKVSVAHLTLSGFTLIPALIANYKHGTAIMLTEHGVFIRERLLAINTSEYPFFLKNLLIRFSESIARLTYYKAEKIISVNLFNKKWELLYGANPNKIEVIYNGIDENVFTPRPKPAHLQGIPTVVALARVFELKDIETMIRSCAVVQKEIPTVQYLVYGDDKAVPEYTRECLKLVKELHLQDNFKFMGPKDNPHLLFSEGDVSILTSISEGFPYTVIESLGCGIPVVATDVGGVSEALTPDCGYVCKPKDAQEIGEKVITLLKDEPLRKKMGLNGRERVTSLFTQDIFIEAYERAYRETATLRRSTPAFVPLNNGA
jgi:glycosyltransferase involved in cell wall biosynthesis